MKKSTTLLLSAAVALLAVAHAHAQATLYGIGDLTGGKIYSQVNDATRSGGVIYAVGGSNDTSNTNNNDKAVLWTSSSPGVLTAIPDFVTNTAGTGGVNATAISSDGTAIAARLHNDASLPVTSAALVTTSGLTSANLGNLGAGLSSQATGISDNHLILYGSVPNGTSGGRTQLVSYTNSAGSISAVPFATGTNLVSSNMFISSQAAVSADGNKVVGTTNNGGPFTTAGSQAFLYIQTGSSLSVDVPYLTGGTWNAGMAINAAGTLGLILGNSTSYATNGQLFLFTDQPTPTTTLLGSPNSAYSFVGGGSLNSDGSVVAAAFNNGTTNLGYIHNASGWFQLDSVASSLGATMTGWSNLNIFGMSDDATLVWGNGLHNGNTEGFVLDLASGSLSAIPEPSAYAALAGLGALGLAAWRRRRLRA